MHRQRLVAAVSASLLGLCLVAAAEEGTGDMAILDGLEHGDRLATYMDCLVSSTRYLGIDVSPAWIYGGTGHAFVMCLTRDLCPSGPHCLYQSAAAKLSKNHEFRINGFFARDGTSENSANARKFVREAIDNGDPCYGWHWEWVLIKGYDEDGYHYSGVLAPPKDWRKFGTEAIGFIEMYNVSRGEAAPDEKAIADALAFAVESADAPDKWMVPGYQGGPAAYDVWIEGLTSGEADPRGAAYHAAIWAECRKGALGFLEEANERTGGRYEALLRPAIEQYRTVATNLASVSETFPLSDEERGINDEQRETAVAALAVARDAEFAGIEALRKIAEELAPIVR